MIRKIQNKDYEDVFSLISTLDHTDDFYCAYTSNDKDQLKNELTKSIEKQTAFVAELDGKLKGIISYFQFNEDVKTYDISGPYIVNHSIDLAHDLFKHVKTELGEGVYHFFFKKESSFYPRLMTLIDAKFKGYEYELKLEKYNFNRLGKPTFAVAIMSSDEQEAVKKIHDETFPDVYLSSKQLVKAKDVYVFHKDEEVIGYALIRDLEYMFYLDVFAIKEDYRNQGYGKQFLSSIIEKSFYKNTHRELKLVVEGNNEEAVKLYLDFGFKVISVNSSYHAS